MSRFLNFLGDQAHAAYLKATAGTQGSRLLV